MSLGLTAAQSREKQGLPPTVEDRAALLRIAQILNNAERRQESNDSSDPRPPVADDFVYFIRSGTGFIKIGRSDNPDRRLRDLATNVPHLELLAVLPNGNLEKDFHRQFAQYRAHGEWFHPGPRLLALLEELKWKNSDKTTKEEQWKSSPPKPASPPTK